MATRFDDLEAKYMFEELGYEERAGSNKKNAICVSIIR